MNTEQRWNDTDREKQDSEIKPVPVPLCPPQILSRLTWAAPLQYVTGEKERKQRRKNEKNFLTI
jgi:hypothetical protein